MQIIDPHLLESEALGVGPAICVLFSPPGGSESLNRWVSEDPYEPAVSGRASMFPRDRHAEAGHSIGHTVGVCSHLLLFFSLVPTIYGTCQEKPTAQPLGTFGTTWEGVTSPTREEACRPQGIWLQAAQGNLLELLTVGQFSVLHHTRFPVKILKSCG